MSPGFLEKDDSLFEVLDDALFEVLEDGLSRSEHGYIPLYRDQEQRKMNASRRNSRRDTATRSSTGIIITNDTSSKGRSLRRTTTATTKPQEAKW